MKPWIWGVTALLALLWTGLVALTHQVTGWLLGAVDGASLQGAADAVGGLALPPLPPELAPWLDAAWLGEWQSALASAVQWLGALVPSGDALMAWIGPALWVGWLLGLLPLLGVAALLHIWLSRRAVRAWPPARMSA